MIRPLISLFASIVLLLCSTSAIGDSISPASFSTTLGVGESVTITKTVTVDAGAPTTSKVDVFFLADETGSMGSAIAAVKTAASTILSSTAALGDIAFGIGGYRDVGDSWVYRTTQDITTSQAAAQTGINAWSAGGGGDGPEAQLYALEQVATTASWRAGSERILPWFGDAPGHDPVNGSTEASATAALVSNNVAVQGVSLNTGGYAAGIDQTGQATRISNATAGALYSGIDTSSIVTAITDAITTSVSTYTSVGLDLSEVPLGVSASYSGVQTGSWDRSVVRNFTFDLTFQGLTPGLYNFNIYGLVDSGRVATEIDGVTVAGTSTAIPVPSSIGLLTIGLLGLSKRRRANML